MRRGKQNIDNFTKIGALDRRVTHRSTTYTRDEYGAEEVSSNTDTEIWAKVSYTGAGEKYAGDQQAEFRRVYFTIRYRSGITAKDVIIYESDTYDILGINEIGRKRFLKLICELRQ